MCLSGCLFNCYSNYLRAPLMYIILCIQNKFEPVWRAYPLPGDLSWHVMTHPSVSSPDYISCSVFHPLLYSPCIQLLFLALHTCLFSLLCLLFIAFWSQHLESLSFVSQNVMQIVVKRRRLWRDSTFQVRGGNVFIGSFSISICCIFTHPWFQHRQLIRTLLVTFFFHWPIIRSPWTRCSRLLSRGRHNNNDSFTRRAQ